MFRSKKLWIVVGAVILLAVSGFWFVRSRSASQKEVTVIRSEKKDLVKVLETSGRVDAHERVLMRFGLGGKVVYLGAREGEFVQKGQTIASLDQRSVKKTLDKTLSTYTTERWDFENAVDSRENRTLPESERRLADQDQFALNRSVLDVEIQSLTVENYRLSAPFSGVLVASPLRAAGVNILTTDTFELANPQTLYFRTLVDEVDITQVSLGQEAIVTLDSLPDEPLKAVVEKVAYAGIDTGSGTVFPVELKFLDNVSIDRHRLEMNGDADLVLERKMNVLSVPLAVLVSRNGDTFVRVRRPGGKIEEVRVELGIETENEAEILSGITEEDEVVLP